MIAGTKFCDFGPIRKKYQTLVPTKNSHLKVDTCMCSVTVIILKFVHVHAYLCMIGTADS